MALFDKILKSRPRRWKFNQSPLFLEFLRGTWELECTPWGSPAYNLFGWQRPCYLLDEGFAKSFDELLEKTEWEKYGRASGNPKCADCMVHCGYEPSAVTDTFHSWRGFFATAWATLFGRLPRWLQKKPQPQDIVIYQPATAAKTAGHVNEGPPQPLYQIELSSTRKRADVTTSV
jgi:hypothetical protein